MSMSEIKLATGAVTKPYYDKYCHYLLLNDVRLDWSNGSFDREEKRPMASALPSEFQTETLPNNG
jgi:hypothetical protein